MPLKAQQTSELKQISEDVSTFFNTSARMIEERDYREIEALLESRRPIFNKVDNLLAAQSKWIKEENYSARNSILFFNFLLETKDLISDAAAFVRLYYSIENDLTPDDPWILVNKT